MGQSHTNRPLNVFQSISTHTRDIMIKILVVFISMAVLCSALPQVQRRARQTERRVEPEIDRRGEPVEGSRGGGAVERTVRQVEKESVEVPSAPYKFSLEVNDDEFTNYQSRRESQDENGVVQGEYSYVAPNGMRITVTYTADANGYHATMREEPTDIVIRAPVPWRSASDDDVVVRNAVARRHESDDDSIET